MLKSSKGYNDFQAFTGQQQRYRCPGQGDPIEIVSKTYLSYSSSEESHLLITRLGVSALGLSGSTGTIINDVILVHGSLLVLLCRDVRIGLRKMKKRSHTKNLIGIGSIGVNGVLNGSLVLLDRNFTLAGTAGVVVVGGDASGGLGGVLGRHVDYVICWSWCSEGCSVEYEIEDWNDRMERKPASRSRYLYLSVSCPPT